MLQTKKIYGTSTIQNDFFRYYNPIVVFTFDEMITISFIEIHPDGFKNYWMVIIRLTNDNNGKYFVLATSLFVRDEVNLIMIKQPNITYINLSHVNSNMKLN